MLLLNILSIKYFMHDVLRVGRRAHGLS